MKLLNPHNFGGKFLFKSRFISEEDYLKFFLQRQCGPTEKCLPIVSSNSWSQREQNMSYSLFLVNSDTSQSVVTMFVEKMENIHPLSV